MGKNGDVKGEGTTWRPAGGGRSQNTDVFGEAEAPAAGRVAAAGDGRTPGWVNVLASGQHGESSKSQSPSTHPTVAGQDAGAAAAGTSAQSPGKPGPSSLVKLRQTLQFKKNIGPQHHRCRGACRTGNGGGETKWKQIKKLE